MQWRFPVAAVYDRRLYSAGFEAGTIKPAVIDRRYRTSEQSQQGSEFFSDIRNSAGFAVKRLGTVARTFLIGFENGIPSALHILQEPNSKREYEG